MVAERVEHADLLRDEVQHEDLAMLIGGNVLDSAEDVGAVAFRATDGHGRAESPVSDPLHLLGRRIHHVTPAAGQLLHAQNGLRVGCAGRNTQQDQSRNDVKSSRFPLPFLAYINATFSPSRAGRTCQPSRSWIAVARVAAAVGSPCTRYTALGGRRNPASQRKISD